jgi:hypothetical protein
MQSTVPINSAMLAKDWIIARLAFILWVQPYLKD